MLSFHGAVDFSASTVAELKMAAVFTALTIQASRPPSPPASSETAALDAEQRSASTRSLRMQEIYNSARRSASGNAPILVTGERGTGKETLARFIHESSERAEGPFVVIQCAAISPGDLEKELFGEEQQGDDGELLIMPGKIDEAAGGTLFLQEVGELDLAFQPKLLRFVQDNAYTRIGSDCAAMSDVKIIATSSIDLAAAVRSGNFREDLWYRLNVVPFHMPPLRERREDVAPLLDFFIQYYSVRFNKRVIGTNDSAISLLQKYDWPGNIRELNNAVERAVLLAESKVLSTSDFAHIEEARRQLNAKSDLERKRDTRPLAEVERQHIIIALKKHNFNQARAAEALGLHRNTLRNKIIEYGIQIPK
jgi:DNA-binding NtrC family response regulator